MNLLETTKLCKTYSRRTVVDEVSFVLAQKEIVGLLGRNGAGKTTTFRMILGMIRPDSGAVAFDGVDVTHLPMYKRARLGIGFLPQERSVFRRLRDEFGKSVLVTDHNIAQTLKVCDRALIINDGRVFKEGTPREIINDPAVRSAYLGHTFRGDEFDEPHVPARGVPMISPEPL